MEQKVKHMVNGDGSVNICLSLRLNKEEVMSGNLKIELDLSYPQCEQESVQQNVVTCFSEYADAYSKKDKRVVIACAKHFAHFADTCDIDTFNLTHTDCRNFRDYLYDNLNGNTPGNYFKKFRQFLDYMVDTGSLKSNPAERIKLTFTDFRPKDVISPKELEAMKKSRHGKDDVVTAFLFSCYTGLRWCDIKDLRRGNIDLEHNTLSVIQKKVANHSRKAELHTFLNKTATELVKARCRDIDSSKDSGCDNLLFELPAYSVMYNHLKHVTANAGIMKHVTFHCARHTFISNLVVKGVDIKTIAELAGHSSTRHTERYMHREDGHLRRSIEVLDS